MRVCVILTTYNQPAYLDLCLFALSRQRHPSFEVIVADDGSGEATRAVVERYQGKPGFVLRHVWQDDVGFRKTRILNKAVQATDADYLLFTDGDCLLAPDFIDRHLQFAQPGRFLTGSIIRLSKRLSPLIGKDAIGDGRAFRAGWLTRAGASFDRRYLRLVLGLHTRQALDRFTTTAPHWMGSNSSCFREDALAVNGFDHRFSYGFEDADFGIRLMNRGREGRNVRWTANALHLFHERPYVTEGMREANRKLVPKIEPGGKTRVEDGIRELQD